MENITISENTTTMMNDEDNNFIDAFNRYFSLIKSGKIACDIPYSDNMMIDESLFYKAVSWIMENFECNTMIRDPSSPLCLMNTLGELLRLIFGYGSIFPIPMGETAWCVIFGLVQIWYDVQPMPPLKYMVELYFEFREERFDSGKVDHHLGYFVDQDDDENDNNVLDMISDTELFDHIYRREYPNILKRVAMWELWEQYDPYKYARGYGNLLVWLPREMVEDTISLMPLCYKLKTTERRIGLHILDIQGLEDMLRGMGPEEFTNLPRTDETW